MFYSPNTILHSIEVDGPL